jgi:hypothetical protein
MRIVLFFVTSALLFACIKKKDVRTYYKNGKVRSRTEIREGKIHGLVEEYYESGSLKSTAQWENDRQNGLTRHYYENGKLESTSHWSNGRQNGESLIYYQDGPLLFSANYKNGRIVGNSRVYFESGGLKERKLYDSAGNLIYIATFKQDGSKGENFVVPVINGIKDTVSVGEQAIITVKFPIQMKGKIFIKTFEKNPDGGILEYEELYPCNSLDSMTYKNSFLIPGTYTLLMRFLHTDFPAGDTLNVKGVEANHKIVVTGTRIQS